MTVTDISQSIRMSQHILNKQGASGSFQTVDKDTNSILCNPNVTQLHIYIYIYKNRGVSGINGSPLLTKGLNDSVARTWKIHLPYELV